MIILLYKPYRVKVAILGEGRSKISKNWPRDLRMPPNPKYITSFFRVHSIGPPSPVPVQLRVNFFLERLALSSSFCTVKNHVEFTFIQQVLLLYCVCTLQRRQREFFLKQEFHIKSQNQSIQIDLYQINISGLFLNIFWRDIEVFAFLG